MVGRQRKSVVEISNSFKDAEMYVADVGHTFAGEARRRAKRSLLDSVHMQNKNKAWIYLDG